MASINSGTFPSHKFKWKTASVRRLCDLFTDASAEDRWGGLGAVLFFWSHEKW